MYPVTKTQQALDLWKAGNRIEAFRIIQTFKMGLSKEDKEIIKIHHEITAGSRSFYESIGYDAKYIELRDIEIVDNYFASSLENN